MRVAVVKHTHHRAIEFDRTGTDTWRAYAAGADPVIGVAPDQVIRRTRATANLQSLLDELASGSDPPAWVLVEGFHGEPPVPGEVRVVMVRTEAEFRELAGPSEPMPDLILGSDPAWGPPRGRPSPSIEDAVQRVIDGGGTT